MAESLIFQNKVTTFLPLPWLYIKIPEGAVNYKRKNAML